MSIENNFWKACDVSGGPDACWPWRRAITNRGYGILRVRGKLKPAHRHAYELVNGVAPPQLVIMHSCDNRPCCNPMHLSLGTYADNNHDAAVKGRSVISRGENNFRAIFIPSQVIEIRSQLEAGENARHLARKLGCSFHAIRDIKNRKTWAWL